MRRGALGLLMATVALDILALPAVVPVRPPARAFPKRRLCSVLTGPLVRPIGEPHALLVGRVFGVPGLAMMGAATTDA